MRDIFRPQVSLPLRRLIKIESLMLPFGHNVQPGQAFASQNLKFTGHLSDDRLLLAGLKLQYGTTRLVGHLPTSRFACIELVV